jgi:hypothetical protein
MNNMTLEKLLDRLYAEGITTVLTHNPDGSDTLELVGPNNATFAVCKERNPQEALLTLIVNCVKTKAGIA